MPPLERWWVTYLGVGAAATIAFIGALWAVAQVIVQLLHPILLLLFGVVVAFVLAPLATRLQPIVRRRGIAILVAFVVALVVALGGLGLIATPLIQQGRALVDQLPEAARYLRGEQPIVILGYEIPPEIRLQVGAAVAERGGEFAGRVVEIIARAVTAVVDIVLVLVLALYLLVSAERIRAFLLRLVPAGQRRAAERVELETVRVFGAYVRGQLLLALIVGVLSTAAYGILGLDYWLILGVFAGIMELVPFIGPIVAGAAAAGVALFQPFPLVLWVIAAATLIQQVENHLLVPRISGGAVGLHPLAVLLAVLFAVEAFGILGALFAVPVVGVIAALARGVRRPT